MQFRQRVLLEAFAPVECTLVAEGAADGTAAGREESFEVFWRAV